jgi:hypothetical protein
MPDIGAFFMSQMDSCRQQQCTPKLFIIVSISIFFFLAVVIVRS